MHPDKRDQLIKLLGMLGSNYEGEVLNAARLAQRLIGSEALTWEDVFKGVPVTATNGSPEAWNAGYAAGYAKGLRAAQDTSPYRKVLTWRAFAIELQEQYFDDLSHWEQGFVENFVERAWNNPTPKQRAVFERIAENLGLNCPGA